MSFRCTEPCGNDQCSVDPCLLPSRLCEYVAAQKPVGNHDTEPRLEHDEVKSTRNRILDHFDVSVVGSAYNCWFKLYY